MNHVQNSSVGVLQALIGLVFLIGLAYVFSTNRKAIHWRTIFMGLVLQSALFLSINYVPVIKQFFELISQGFVRLLDYSNAGASFVFGALTEVNEKTPWGFLFAFKVLPVIIFFSAFTALLFHFGILQKIVQGMGWVMRRIMNLSGPESLTVAGNVFIGQTEAPLLIKPYIKHMSQSELACIMIAGLSTLAGSVLAAFIGFLGGNDPQEQIRFATYLLTASFMNAPAAVIFAKMVFPDEPGAVKDHGSRIDRNLEDNMINAVADGAISGMRMAAGVATILIAVVALIALFNGILTDAIGLVSIGGQSINQWVQQSTSGIFNGLTLQYIFGQIFRPVAFLIGIDWQETLQVGSLLGSKVVLNEFVAYGELSKLKLSGALSPQAILVSTFALSSFSNFSSVGICVAGIGSLCPEKQPVLARIGIRALFAAVLAGLLTACVASIWYALLGAPSIV
jgi:CNT family concentrative nucleoside transporter